QRLDWAAIDIAAGDRIAFPGAGAVQIFGDRRHQARIGSAVEDRGALHDPPAEIGPGIARAHQVDLLAHALADIADPQIAGDRVEAVPEWIPQAIGPDLGQAPAAGEGIAGGD